MLPACFINPGDITMMTVPGYPVAGTHTRYYGGTVYRLPLLAKNHFYPDFSSVTPEIWERTKLLVLNYPNSPTGQVATREFYSEIVALAKKYQFVVVQDAAHILLSFKGKPLSFLEVPGAMDVGVEVHSMSKGFDMIGWRIGWVHGPSAVIDKMTALQQYTFVCAPHPMQYGALAGLEVDLSAHYAEYKQKRDFVRGELAPLFEIEGAQGAFYLFPKAPWGTGTEFVAKAIENSLLIIPGKVFSPADTHFRISYAAEQKTLERGCEILKKLAKG
jgi:LL-diaminopimelate aminotransferase